jgi:hypothetical protein
VEAPDLLDLTVVQSHFETERLPWVSFDLEQTLNQFIHIVGDCHDLAARDSDEFPGERGPRVIPRLLVDLPGELTVEFGNG